MNKPITSFLPATVFSALTLVPFLATAGDVGEGPHDTTSSFSVSGSVGMSTGEVVKGKYRAMKGNGHEDIKHPSTVYRAWFGQPRAKCDLAFTPGDRLKVLAGFEANVFVNTFPADLKTTQSSNGGQPILPSLMDWRIHQAQGIVSLADDDRLSVKLSLGYMPYKYNPHVRNLGEYLFRSGTYPFFLMNEVDFPAARLSGLLATVAGGTGRMRFTVDQLVLTERNIPPLNDISFATIASVNFSRFIDVGAGVNFSHAVPVDGRLTTPDDARYVTDLDTVRDAGGTPVPDPATGGVAMAGDTGHYTFQGIKLMARAAVDPFARLRGQRTFISGLLGENGGKLYGEIAVIGVKNYPSSFEMIDGTDAMNPWGYESIAERTPLMAGINVPLWKILDVCAIEIERYPAPYPNDYYQVVMNKGLPIPTWYRMYHDSASGYDSSTYRNNRWYWSLYMKKRVVKNFSLVGWIGRDHMRWDVNLGNKCNYDTEEILAKPDQWAWRLEMVLEF
ncbi:MAG: hypothetical protein JXA18_04830 [Chitinispirillaceae bacterium]|nr:hypothetical protein [Chitinispirillaceae bacterium]